jgi:hypothetical protein
MAVKRIDNVAAETFAVAYDLAGVEHNVVLEPGQSLITGQPELISSDDPAEFAGLVAVSGLPIQPLPPEPTGTDLGEEVERGRVYDFNGTFYVCVQTHNRQQFDPADTPALFTEARLPLDPWVQPTGAQDAYAIGDLVTHDNPNDGGEIWVYESNINANTTEPGRDGTFDRWWRPVSRLADYSP